MDSNILVATQMLCVGISGVFGVLIFYAIVIWLIGNAGRWFAKKPQAAPASAGTPAAAPKTDPRDLVAVIAAAATVAIGSKVKVTRISFLAQHDATTWTEAGVHGIMASHTIIPKGHSK